MRNTLIAASALALLAGGANAAVLNYTSTSGAVSTSPAGSGSIFAASFNDALGTLLSATYQITFAPAANGTLTNNSGATGDYTVSLTGFVSTAGDVPAAFFPGPLGSDSLVGVADGATVPWSVSDSTSTGGSLALAIADQAGPIEMTYNNTQASLSATGPLPVNLSTLSADFVYTLDVTYVYDDGETEVPVPAALPLLAAAFGVMGFVRSRRA